LVYALCWCSLLDWYVLFDYLIRKNCGIYSRNIVDVSTSAKLHDSGTIRMNTIDKGFYMGNSHDIYETHTKRTRTQSNIFCFISTINCYCSGELDLKSKPLWPIVCFPVFCLSISSSLFNFSHSIHCRTFLREKIEKK
jgi:hypothetical protein